MTKAIFQGLGAHRTLIGVFKEGDTYYIKVEGSRERWEVEPDAEHLKLLGQHVRATGWEIGTRRIIVVEMQLAG
jgi:hypothetical protein